MTGCLRGGILKAHHVLRDKNCTERSTKLQLMSEKQMRIVMLESLRLHVSVQKECMSISLNVCVWVCILSLEAKLSLKVIDIGLNLPRMFKK